LHGAFEALMNHADTPPALRELDAISLARREFLCITRAELEVVVSDRGAVRFIAPRATADSPPVLVIPKGSRLLPGTYSGVVEFQMSMRDHVMVCVTSVADEEPRATVMTETTGSRREQVESLWTRAREHDRVAGKLPETFAEVRQDSIIQLCVTRCVQQATHLYRHVVMHMFEHLQWHELKPRLIERGLLAILTPSQLELIAACSMAPTARMPFLQEIAIKAMGATEGDLRAAYDQLSPLLSVKDSPDEWKQFLLCL
jgi:hypothetical protein